MEGWQSLAVGQKVESAAIDHHGNDHDHDVHDDNDNDDDNDDDNDYDNDDHNEDDNDCDNDDDNEDDPVSCKLIVIDTLLLQFLQRTRHKGKSLRKKKRKTGDPGMLYLSHCD